MRTISVDGEIIDMAKILTEEIVKSGTGVLKRILSGEKFVFYHKEDMPGEKRICVKINGNWVVEYS